jgi:hypothetical protein
VGGSRVLAEGRVQLFDAITLRVYAKWLVDDVLGTLRRSDATKGSLGAWHLVLGWEREVSILDH